MAATGQGSRSAMSLVLLGTAAVLLISLGGAAATTTFIVGGSYQWAIPDGNDINFYEEWAAEQNFIVGDVLDFKYTAEDHNVLPLNSKAGFDACNSSDTSGIPTDSGETKITLKTVGVKWYICSIPSHCNQGMKVAITVTNGTNATTAPSPSPPSAAAPLPGFGTVIIAVVIAAAALFQ